MMKGAIFDVDGTLLDSMGIWDNLAERYLTERGIEPEEHLSEKLSVFSLEESSEYLKKTYGLEGTPDEIRSDIMGIVANFYKYEVLLKLGAKQLLEKLKKQNISMNIATTGDVRLVHAAFGRLGIDGYFEHIFTCTELNTTKREPFIYQKAAEAMNCRPEETLVFEDALHAVETAVNAGFVTVGVAEKANQRDREKIKEFADYYLESLADWNIT